MLYKKEIRFSEAQRVVEDFGWTLRNIDGSHYIYEKAGMPDLTMVKHKNRLERHYLDKIVNHIGLEEWYELNKK